ncbi:MAG: hypothetical protein KAV87_16205 [Desulfobacteraceae bacterium]|nr:hypothetical protein [Desulfobacteraceae bacterium]
MKIRAWQRDSKHKAENCTHGTVIQLNSSYLNTTAFTQENEYKKAIYPSQWTIKRYFFTPLPLSHLKQENAQDNPPWVVSQKMHYVNLPPQEKCLFVSIPDYLQTYGIKPP